MIVSKPLRSVLVSLGAAACLGASGVAGGAGVPQAQPLDLPAVAAATACAGLATADVSPAVGARTAVTAAAVVDDGKSAAYCALKVTIDDYARIELRLPVAQWHQRLLFTGGFLGPATSTGLRLDQFATVTWGDLGHRTEEDLFANNPRYQINAAYRGMHWQVLAAKALIGRYYGRGPRFSYFNACSNPGREGMIEAERFPEDFDGIGAGCPPINQTLNNTVYNAWNALTNTDAAGHGIITADTLPILHKVVLDQCDAADGVRDGIVSDPLACHPRPAVAQCRPGAGTAGCLTAAQVHAAEELYRGPHDASGRMLAPSGILPGSELAWTATIVPTDEPSSGLAVLRNKTEQTVRSHYTVPPLPKSWTLADFRFDRATFDRSTAFYYLHDGINTDLSAYAKAGHKLMLWMALADPYVLPTQVIHYFDAMRRQLGTKTVDGFARLYPLPGVYHCGNGEGPVIADLLPALIAWVEQGKAPGALLGTHVPRKAAPGEAPPAADLTRPLYPYPLTARYAGTGDIRDAANYRQGPARPAPASLADWPGARLYAPGATRWCTEKGTGMTCTNSR